MGLEDAAFSDDRFCVVWAVHRRCRVVRDKAGARGRAVTAPFVASAASSCRSASPAHGSKRRSAETARAASTASASRVRALRGASAVSSGDGSGALTTRPAGSRILALRAPSARRAGRVDGRTVIRARTAAQPSRESAGGASAARMMARRGRRPVNGQVCVDADGVCPQFDRLC